MPHLNVDKTKVMASDGIACRILIQNELLEQVDTFLTENMENSEWPSVIRDPRYGTYPPAPVVHSE